MSCAIWPGWLHRPAAASPEIGSQCRRVRSRPRRSRCGCDDIAARLLGDSRSRARRSNLHDASEHSPATPAGTARKVRRPADKAYGDTLPTTPSLVIAPFNALNACQLRGAQLVAREGGQCPPVAASSDSPRCLPAARLPTFERSWQPCLPSAHRSCLPCRMRSIPSGARRTESGPKASPTRFC
jgi:hypothetical protein